MAVDTQVVDKELASCILLVCLVEWVVVDFLEEDSLMALVGQIAR